MKRRLTLTKHIITARPKGEPRHTYTIALLGNSYAWWRSDFITRDRVDPLVLNEGPGPYCRVAFGA